MWSWVKMVFSGLFLGFTACAHADLAIDPLPFPPGETLTDKLHWGFFHVGTGVLSVKGPLTFQGEPAYRLTFNLRTNGFADALYPIRDIHVSYVNLDFTRTLHISKKEKHKNKSRVVEVIFDWVKKQPSTPCGERRGSRLLYRATPTTRSPPYSRPVSGL